jgi:hypothetical protein
MATLEPGSYNAMSLSLFNSELFVFYKNLRSLKVPPGFSVTLYAGDNFQGEARVIREDTPCLDSFNDATTSLVFRADPGEIHGRSRWVHGRSLVTSLQGRYRWWPSGYFTSTAFQYWLP